MRIVLNGKDLSLDGAVDLAALLEAQGYGGMLVAVARNGAFVPKGAYGSTALEEGDTVEIVSPMQGG